MLLLILGISAAVFIPTIVFITSRNHRDAVANARERSLAQAEVLMERVQNYIDLPLEQVQTLRHHALSLREHGDMNQGYLHSLTTSAIESNASVMAAWTIWEPNAMASADSMSKRLSVSYYRDYDGIKRRIDKSDYQAPAYVEALQSKGIVVQPPSFHTYFSDESDLTFRTTISIPLYTTITKMLGAVGIDMNLDGLSDIVGRGKLHPTGLAVLLSQQGHILADADRLKRNKPFDDMYYDLADSTIMGMVSRAMPYNDFHRCERTGKRVLLTLQPISPTNGSTNWVLCLITPEAAMMVQARAFARSSVTMCLLGLLVMAVLAWVLGTRIARPIRSTTKVLGVLAEGQISLDNKLNIKTGDELEQIASSVNYLIDNLDRMVGFALEIGKGNLNVPFKKMSHNDVLGEALLNMRANLEIAHEHDQLRKAEEEKERWSNEGIAQFSELLRRNYSNMEEFAHSIITHMVSYTETNVGGLFLLNTDDTNNRFFELCGCFAYDGLKYEQKRIAMGEGLVGRCAKEAETILMTELPEGYIKIATGLGYDNPTCLLLVPMKHNEEVLGVIELAAFGQIEPHHVSFVEKIGASMAATISNIKVNVHTTQLLEESRIKSEELASQEEEMRQNMEELQATQEEAARKNFEMESFINALNSSSFMVEYDLDGRVLSANKAYQNLLKMAEHDMMGLHHADNLVLSEAQKASYQKFWDDLARGMVKKTTHKQLIDNVEYTFLETYSPIVGDDGLVKRVLKISHSITDFGLAAEQQA